MKQFYLKCSMALFAMLFSVQMYAVTEVTINNIKYQLAGVEAYVIGYTGTPVDVVIPETITTEETTFKVTKISEKAFNSCGSLSTFRADYISQIEEGYKSGYVCTGSFYGCTGLKRISLKSIQSIGECAFRGCSSLIKVDLGTHPVDIEGYAFEDCTSLKYIVIPAGSTYRYSNNCEFSGCSMLQSIIYLGDNLGKHGSNANAYSAADLIKWSKNSFAYTGEAPQPSFTNTAPAGFQVTKARIMGLNVNAGAYTDSLTFTFTNQDMSFDAKIPYNYTIIKASLTAKVQNATRNYGDENPQFTVTYSSFVNGEDKRVLDNPGVVVTSANKSSEVGTYTIELQGAKDNNYNITQEPGTLSVIKAPLIVKAADKERTYGASNPQFTLEFSGLKNNEATPTWITKPVLGCNADESSPVGTYDINISKCEARNYTVSLGIGTLTVSKAPLRITANNISRLYYEPNTDFKCSYDGFMNGETSSILICQPQFSTSASIDSKAGNYPINVSGAKAKNYTITYASGVLQVQKRSLNVSTENQTRAYNEDNPKFTIIYKGFVNGENENVLIAKPTVTTEATKLSDVGTYTIVVSGGMADNYNFVYSNGSLIIEKAYQTLNWEQDLSKVSLYSQVELTAQASSNLPITYKLDNDTVCGLTYIGSNTYIDCQHYGKVVISAYQSGNHNYWPTTKSYKVLTVTDPSGIKNILVDKKLTERINVINDCIYVPSLTDQETISVYTMTGRLIYHGHEQTVRTGKGIFIVKIGDKSAKTVVR